MLSHLVVVEDATVWWARGKRRVCAACFPCVVVADVHVLVKGAAGIFASLFLIDVIARDILARAAIKVAHAALWTRVDRVRRALLAGVFA